ncbi:hypothetical protein MRB53_023642 [Persea americana]|uniref:Uncharacterized protein n=1 Tax=Persea americana TaxID=3435 RepID=A0ACC2LA22_PERAE|nr:hypothetical protein MRB53_023642 [Persea americana]
MSALYSHGNSPQPLPLATVAFILYTPSGHCCLHLHMRTRSPATTAFHVSSHYTWAAILLPAEDRPLHLPQPANLLSLHSSTATVLPATVTGHSFSCYSHQPFSLLPAISRGHCCPSPQRLSALCILSSTCSGHPQPPVPSPLDLTQHCPGHLTSPCTAPAT